MWPNGWDIARTFGEALHGKKTTIGGAKCSNGNSACFQWGGELSWRHSRLIVCMRAKFKPESFQYGKLEFPHSVHMDPFFTGGDCPQLVWITIPTRLMQHLLGRTNFLAAHFNLWRRNDNIVNADVQAHGVVGNRIKQRTPRTKMTNWNYVYIVVWWKLMDDMLVPMYPWTKT